MAAERTQSPDYHEDVQRYSGMYSIEQWLQPRSMVQVQLAKLKEETRCPMCFGKIRQARISMVCLHRYCAKCIEQYLRAKVPGRHGDDKECPVCRAHLHSRRATKPDHAFDKIIKALYGDVEQFDAEEEELIAEDNKAHVAAWQVQLAELKAKQAAAVAAARGGPQAVNDSPEQPAGRSGTGGRPPTASGGVNRYLLPRNQMGHASADGAAAGALGVGSMKRSWSDLQQQQRTEAPEAAGSRAVAKMDVREQLKSKSERSRGAQQQQQRGSSLYDDDRLQQLTGDPGRYQTNLQQQLGALAQIQAAAKKKKKVSPKDMAARMLGIAARSAAPSAHMCLVHLQPFGRTAGPSNLAGAAPPAAGGEGRRRKPQHQGPQVPQGGTLNVDQPYLICPWELTVGCLKELVVQQLSQQAAALDPDPSDVELLLPPASGDSSTLGSSGSSAAVCGVLSDQLTIGLLYDSWWGLGPELRVQYRLLRS